MLIRLLCPLEWLGWVWRVGGGRGTLSLEEKKAGVCVWRGGVWGGARTLGFAFEPQAEQLHWDLRKPPLKWAAPPIGSPSWMGPCAAWMQSEATAAAGGGRRRRHFHMHDLAPFLLLLFSLLSFLSVFNAAIKPPGAARQPIDSHLYPRYYIPPLQSGGFHLGPEGHPLVEAPRCPSRQSKHRWFNILPPFTLHPILTPVVDRYPEFSAI